MCCANVRVFCFDEGAIYAAACDSGRDPVLISQQEMRFDEVEMWCYDTAAAEECVWPRRHPLIEEGEDKVHGDINDEFSVLVSLEEFMKEFRTLHHGRGAASVMGKPSVIY